MRSMIPVTLSSHPISLYIPICRHDLHEFQATTFPTSRTSNCEVLFFMHFVCFLCLPTYIVRSRAPLNRHALSNSIHPPLACLGFDDQYQVYDITLAASVMFA